MNGEKPEKMEMISQPLLDSEGRINPACINELNSTILSIPPTYLRLTDDSEWNTPEITFWKEIVGAFAHSACLLSPYGCPDNLETICKYLVECLKREEVFTGEMGKYGMGKISLCEINRTLHEILFDIPEFKEWNHCKKGETPDIQFSCEFDGERDPDYDFIDLDALLHNVCLIIRDERRKNKAFDEKFEREWKEQHE